MVISLKHKFTSAKQDGLDATQIQPSNWNDEHDLELASGRLLGRTTAGTGAAEEISVGAGLTLEDAQLLFDTAYQFGTLVAAFARVTHPTAAIHDLQATSADDAIERSRRVRTLTQLLEQTVSADGSTVVATDTATDIGASGVSARRLNINGLASLLHQASVLLLEGNNPGYYLDDTSGTPDTHRRVFLQYADGVLTVGVAQADGTFAGSGLQITFGANGAIQHSFFSYSSDLAAQEESLRLTEGFARARTIAPFSNGVGFVGLPSLRYEAIYAVNGTIQTSDAREKQDIATLADAERRVALRIKGLVRTYRWKEELGRDDKKHFGVIAQDVIEVFEAEGLNWQDYGIISGGGDEPFGVNLPELNIFLHAV